MTLNFLRNKVVEVEPRTDGCLSVFWRLFDDLLKAEVELTVQPPELEILEAKATLNRFLPKGGKKAAKLIEKIEGVSIGPGLRKIVQGLIGGPDGCPLLADAILECSNAVILHYTRPGIEIGEGFTDPEEKMAGLRAMLKTNPRLVRSCIAFQDDSPIMKGLDL